ncbi:acyl-CoA carboxylase epsilon subunit [Kitasatospora sp. NBC_01287]|uniref:acyl-CoA carboxylase epsilon subunit n=1 Tax=Kitasatospora sp. NBC_01287 TaxID=2903573 RepID=UPI002258AAC3|nr:acyl-CoA carboxylase epsilon subunit [Kitasatospora sp. NBC_01287]MCX4748904.1 acyl-CoA carboxylase epsilon subunit [Kitasatospora sp. NBC_01287]
MLTIQVLHGNPTPDELAAATAVLLARLAARAPGRPAPAPLPLTRRRTSWRMATAYRPPAAWASVG